MPASQQKPKDEEHFMPAVKVWRHLGGRSVLEAFEKAGKLKPCVRSKPKGHKGRCTVLYLRAHIEWAKRELEQGRWPVKEST